MLHWFSFRSGGLWRVSLVNREETDVLDDPPRGHKVVGATYPKQRAIYLDAAESRGEQDVVALHEILHAALDDARLPLWLEERVVKKLSGRLLPVLMQFGFRFPRRPLGAADLERHARKPAP